MDHSIQLECGHWFHSKCAKQWCKTCIANNGIPSCPQCRQSISDEYLDILCIHYSTNVYNFTSSENTIAIANIIANAIQLLISQRNVS